MLEIRELYFSYGKKQVLSGVDLTAADGLVTTVIGPNGCGKSTLLRCVAGILTKKSGSILADGVSLDSLSVKERARTVSYLSQSASPTDISTGRLVLSGRFAYLSYPRRYGRADREAADAAMRRMGIEEYSSTPVSDLSGGTVGKAYIAMALSSNAPVLLLDEPSAHLDVSSSLSLLDTERELAKEGRCVLTVSHDIISALSHSDVLAVMDEGCILAAGTPEEVLSSGIISRVFGVDVASVITEDGVRYYYRRLCP